MYTVKITMQESLKFKFVSLLDAVNLKNDFSVCKLLGRLLEIFAPWNEKVLRPVSVLTFEMTTSLLFLRVFTL